MKTLSTEVKAVLDTYPFKIYRDPTDGGYFLTFRGEVGNDGKYYYASYCEDAKEELRRIEDMKDYYQSHNLNVSKVDWVDIRNLPS